jgi:serine phosphatase RsbU (regulator of sigma subunit)/anti-sigma regulatory factor (Ser/Thr protein kinase)
MERTQRVFSIRWIVSGAVVALTVATVLTVGLVGERGSHRALTREVQTRLLLEARNLALTSSRALLSDFPELTLAPILSQMGTTEERALTAVVDLDGKIRGHANARLIGTEFRIPPTALPQATVAGLRSGEQMLVDENLLIAAAPVRHPQEHRIGMAYVSFPRDYVTGILAEARRNQVALVGILLVAGIALVPLLMAHLLRPVGALREGLERIGRGDLETPVRLRDRTEFGLLADTMNRMSAGLRDAQEEKLEKERLSREVELAREIQSSLLPSGDVHCGSFVIDGAHRAAAEVGGDIWDVFPLEGGRYGVAIADVSGKGLAGCLVTSMLSALLRAFAPEESSPSALLVRLEKHLSLRSGTFITMFYGILDPARGELTYASAAHSPLLRLRADGAAEWIHTDGIPIGAVRGGALAGTLSDATLSLEPGDVLVQYTDGINEAFEPADTEQFGFERLEKAARLGAGDGPRAVIGHVQRALSGFTADRPALDDETLLVIGFQGARPERNASPDPTDVLAEAKRTGRHFELDASLDTLAGIRRWIEECPGLDRLPEEKLTLLESALYEVCANVVEHGYGADPSHSFEMWWVPAASGAPAGGRFVVVDSGQPFEPDDSTVDFADPKVRRRGRGLGLEIIRGAMRQVSFHPDTPHGNVTILEFDPNPTRVEVPHA